MILPRVNLSVFKREDIEYDEVKRKLIDDGWDQTGKIRDSVYYFEKSGFNITVVDGPRAVSAFPSGPVRGRIFSNVVGDRDVDSVFDITFNDTPEFNRSGEDMPQSMESNTTNNLLV